MHELGHNLGLRHGGDSEVNNKPGYISVMNYMYTGNGLPVVGSPSEGDRYHLQGYFLLGIDCGVIDWLELERGPFSADMVIDYSDGTSAALLESAVSEPLGLGRPTSGPVDFDCDGSATNTVAVDLNFDGATGANLGDFDDWSNLRFVFSREPKGNDHGPTSPADRGFDPLTNDRQPVSDEVAPPAGFFERRRR